MLKCTCCEGADVEYSESRGEAYCTRCGAVLEENRMVEAVSFTETSSGAVRAIGQFIPSSAFGGGFAMSYGSRESREQALQRGYTHIQRIAERLRLPLNLVESAQRVYLMGMQRSFTMGRLSSHVAAACLYVSCRRERSPQMLIDFSDVLTTPVKTLGAVFVKLLRVLHIHVPTIDPSLFMERFASQIPLGDKTNVVAQTGVRLVQAMARDWICTGRRPTGLCGAALLIAARYHGVRINAEDISTVIRMSTSTVNKRLSEFRQTSTAQLKSSEFETTDLLALPVLEGPPCMKTTHRKVATMALELNEEPYRLMDGSANDEKDIATSFPSLTPERSGFSRENSCHKEVNGLVGGIRIPANEDEICNTAPSSSSISSLAERMLGAIESQVPSRPPLEKATQSANPPCTPQSDTIKEGNDEKEQMSDGAKGETNATIDALGDPEDTLGELLRDVKKKAQGLGSTAQTTRLEYYSTDDINTPFGNLNTALAVPFAASSDQKSELEESLSDISETEIDWMLLSFKEKEAKKRMWSVDGDEMMKDVMPEVHRRLREKRRREREPSSKKPRRKVQRNDLEPAASPADSVRAALESKNRSFAKRLNGDALNSLFSNNSSNGTNDDPGAATSTYQSLFT